MAAFSQQYPPSLRHPAVWLPNSSHIRIPPNLSGFRGITDTFFSCYSSDPHHNVAVDVTVHGNCLENNDRMIGGGDREPSSVIEKRKKTDSSSSVVIEPQISGDHQATLEKTHTDKKRKDDQLNRDVTHQGKDKKRKKCRCTDEKKDSEENPTAYVHVRARRGQATDSHSLAERARREKISKKMKLLQALVPGCDKINSKALLLDEIINYVQVLQNQVESLSMKLASVNPTSYGFGGDLDDFMKLGSTVLPEDATTFFTTDNCPIMDSSVWESLPIVFCQDNENLLGDIEEQKQMLIYQSSEFDNFCNF